MRYGILVKSGVTSYWYSDFTLGLLEDGIPFPNIFFSEDEAHKYAHAVGIHDYLVKFITVMNFCDLHLEEGSNQCKYCDCHKGVAKYE